MCILISNLAQAQERASLKVIAYYAGHNMAQLDSFHIEKLSHIIYSFCHLKGERLNVDNAVDTAVIQKLVSLKSRNPQLKVLLSLGGWGGCETCSEVFSTKQDRKVFANSVKEISDYFHTDGIDLDWEYPAIPGYPGHKYGPADKKNFTSLVKELRKTLGKKATISFAAGGFTHFIEESVEWKKVMKYADMANLMTYDLVHGFSTTTGHHTPLYSTDHQTESVDHAVQLLVKKGVSPKKLVIGAAFYGREWEGVANVNNGLYQTGKFRTSVSWRNFAQTFPTDSGYVYQWDEKAQAPYLYHPGKGYYFTYEDTRSIALKTAYAIQNGLGGIMFWQLTGDVIEGGLLDAIDKAKK